MQEESREELTVAGYIDATHTDALMAEDEIKRISLIESKMDMTNMSIVLGIYNKALDSGTFQTPIGLEFMHSMYDTLIQSGINREKIRPIPLYTTFKRTEFKESAFSRQKSAKQTNIEKELRIKYRNSVLISIIFGVLAGVMLLIMLRGTTPNALNYKIAVTNQYAEWEDDLKAREEAVRQKERELNINFDE